MPVRLAKRPSLSSKRSVWLAFSEIKRSGCALKVREHKIVLRGERVVLRPLTEDDWGPLLKWNSDPEVLYFAEGDDVRSYTIDEIQTVYRSVSQTAFCFVIEAKGAPVGECWLQQMNLERILQQVPEADSRRIDLTIGEKQFWGQGLGTEVIQILSTFAFGEQGADLVFGCNVADYNRASLRALQKAGYTVFARIEQPVGKKGRYRYDLFLTRDDYTALGTRPPRTR
jgi:RimJ/RimL family protein N-acetyltransferase